MQWEVFGADRQTGEDKTLIIEADNIESARRRGNRRGLFVAEVHLVPPPPPEPEPEAEPEPEHQPELEDQYDSEPEAEAESLPASEAEPEAEAETPYEPEPAEATEDVVQDETIEPTDEVTHEADPEIDEEPTEEVLYDDPLAEPDGDPDDSPDDAAEALPSIDADGIATARVVQAPPVAMQYAVPVARSRSTRAAPAYTGLRVASYILFGVAILFYFVSGVMIVLGIVGLFASSQSPIAGMIGVSALLPALLALAGGAIYHGLSAACLALRDMAQNSFR